MTIGLDHDLVLEFRKAQDVLSNQKMRGVTLEETLKTMLSEFLRQRDPFEKTKRAVAKKGSSVHSGEQDRLRQLQKKI